MTDLPSIHCLGLNHASAPVLLREELALSASDQIRFLGAAREDPTVGGLAYLSTCNRVEFYWTQHGEQPAGTVVSGILQRVGFSLANVESRLYHASGLEAAERLGRVACGLDSLVLGEAEVLGQLVRAFRVSDEMGASDDLLRLVFQFAIKTGRRARAETEINRNPVSVSSVAVRQAATHLGSLAGKSATILGLGQTGTLVGRVLEKEGLNKLFLVNRTIARARAYAQEFSGEALGIMDLPKAISESDVVFACTGCPVPMISPEMADQAMQERPDRPLLFIDLAVPHDVDPKVAGVRNAARIDVDALKPRISGSLTRRRQAIPDVEAILADELRRFDRTYREMGVQPLINDLRRQVEDIRKREFGRLAERLPDLSEAEIALVERFSQSLVQKLFHHPTTRIRREASEEFSGELMQTVRSLFQLRDRAS